MESFLSGFSTNGAQIGQGYTGTVTLSGTSGANNSLQVADVSQLQPGDTFQGEIVSVNGEDVQIQLTNGEYMTARLERDVQIAIGQLLNLQVQSNKDNRIVLKPVYDGRMQMLRVGEAALRAAHMAVSDKNMTLVSALIENGMSINKNTLMAFNRLMLQNPGVGMADLIKLNKLQLPVNDNSITQLHNYQSMEHRLIDGIREASEEILKLYDTLTEGTEIRDGQNIPDNVLPNAVQGSVAGQAALENGGKFMEQVLMLLSGDEGLGNEVQQAAAGKDNTGNLQESQNVQGGQYVQSNEGSQNSQNVQNLAGQETEKNTGVLKENPQLQPENADIRQAADEAAEQATKPVSQNVENGINSENNEPQKNIRQDTRPIDVIINQLKGEKPQALPSKIISAIREGARDGKLDIKDVKQLLMDSDVGKQLTTEQKAVIFHSEPFKSLLKNGLQRQWTLRPQDLMQEGRVEEFYQKLSKESSQLARMMNEAMQGNGQGQNASQARAVNNINENVEFMNQMNQVFNYVQLPLKLGNSQAHGDLYVYTNKKNMARKDGMLTAFLHLDMDYLGALDVSISLQTEKNQVTTKFYLDEDSIALVEGHIEELAQRLSKKGYQCKNLVLEKEEDKTVLERMEEQVAGGNAVMGYRTFDTRA